MPSDLVLLLCAYIGPLISTHITELIDDRTRSLLCRAKSSAKSNGIFVHPFDEREQMGRNWFTSKLLLPISVSLFMAKWILRSLQGARLALCWEQTIFSERTEGGIPIPVHRGLYFTIPSVILKIVSINCSRKDFQSFELEYIRELSQNSVGVCVQAFYLHTIMEIFLHKARLNAICR